MCGYSLLSMLILLYNYRANYPVPASLHLWPTTNYSVNLSLSLMTQWLRITNTALSPGTWPGHTILLNFFITIKHKIQQPLEIFIKFPGFHQIFFSKIFRSMEKHYLIIFFFFFFCLKRYRVALNWSNLARILCFYSSCQWFCFLVPRVWESSGGRYPGGQIN